MSMTLAIEELRTDSVDGVRRPPTTRRRGWRLGLTGVVLAAVLFAVGGTMRNDADFAKEYVARQLGEQQIFFKPAAALTDEERQTPCLVAFAGQPLTTGAQAECYANSFIGHHLKSVAGGKTYAQMRDVQTGLRADIAQAQAAGDPAAADLQRQLAEVTGKRQTLFEGETVRGLLLTSFGFSTLGGKADLAANLAEAAGAVVAVLSLVVLAPGVVRRSAGR
jgi:hypothetical protein